MFQFREDKYDIINILLETKGVDPNIKDSRGDSLATPRPRNVIRPVPGPGHYWRRADIGDRTIFILINFHDNLFDWKFVIIFIES